MGGAGGGARGHAALRRRGADRGGIAEVARTGVFWVPEDDPLTTDGRWAVTKVGTHVRVPILAYRTPERALASIWALGVQLGLAAAASLGRRTPAKPAAAHMIFGHE